MFRWLSLFSSIFFLLSLCALGALILLKIPYAETWAPPVEATKQEKLPSFFQYETCLENLDKGALELEWEEPKMQLPNLQQTLLYYGISKRPDLPQDKIAIHLGISSEDEIFAYDTKKPIYLSFQGDSAPLHEEYIPFENARMYSPLGEQTSQGFYRLSPNNTPTPLWLEINEASLMGGGKQCSFTVNMLDDEGTLIDYPQEHRQFTLSAREIPKSLLIGWQLGEHRVDSTLLLRQKARWIGTDRFLEMHGGEEFSYTVGRERIDFLGGDESYSCYVKSGDFFVWNGETWIRAESDESSDSKPLLVVKKIEENVMHFQLWDPSGKGSIQLNLVKSKDMTPVPNIEEEFKFIGAKTWSKFIVESHGERLILKAHDWLVLTEEQGWVALDSEELIQEYVSGKLQGPLLVLEKLVKTQAGQTLLGHLFNSSRTEAHPISLSANSKGFFGVSPSYPPLNEENKL